MPDRFRAIACAAGLSLSPGWLPMACAGDAGMGKAVFSTACSVCHSALPGENQTGPTLFGVVGRKTGSIAGYGYSTAIAAANVTWDEAALDRYLQAPRSVMPGTRMTYGGLKDATKRADLIAYLATLK